MHLHFISFIFLSFAAYVVFFCTTTESLNCLHGSFLLFWSPVSAQYHPYQRSFKSDSQAGTTPDPFLLKPPSRGEEIWTSVKQGQQPLLNHFKKVLWSSAGPYHSLPDQIQHGQILHGQKCEHISLKVKAAPAISTSSSFCLLNCIFFSVRFAELGLLNHTAPGEHKILFHLPCTKQNHRLRRTKFPLFLRNDFVNSACAIKQTRFRATKTQGHSDFKAN